MKIIDAHIHFRQGDQYFDRIARQAGHINTEGHLRESFAKEGIESAIVMSNLSMAPEHLDYPDYLYYCVGIDRNALLPDKAEASVAAAEAHLRLDRCVGLKLYAGYTRHDLSDPVYEPYYALAERYGKPVAVHTGVTANANALLRYSHPLQLDQAAVEHPKLSFVMCHFGNPWLADAAAVLEKNGNVFADLSGLLVGRIDLAEYLLTQKGYAEQLKTWIAYVDDYGKFMFGTDWPLAGFGDYIRLVRQLIPERHHEKVFYANARRIYGLPDISGKNPEKTSAFLL